MSTINQISKKKRKKKQRSSKVPALTKCPQKKGVCLKILERSPKKPNSASRKLALIRLTNKRRVYAYVPGIEHQPSLQEHSVVLIRGGRVKDLPGIKYKLIRGVYDFAPIPRLYRSSARSKYGTKLK
jgi:small subunit ribosomal protein S12